MKHRNSLNFISPLSFLLSVMHALCSLLSTEEALPKGKASSVSGHSGRDENFESVLKAFYQKTLKTGLSSFS
jgi:hypothetical protein